MRMVIDKEDHLPSDSYVPDTHSNPSEQDISLVYKPGKEKEFQVISSPTKRAFIDIDRISGLIVMVIFSWICLLGGISILGIELDAAYIPGSLAASLVFVFLINYIYKKTKQP